MTTPRGLLSIVTLFCFLLSSVPAPAAVPTGPAGSTLARRAEGEAAAAGVSQAQAGPENSLNGALKLALYDGSTVVIGRDGLGTIRDARGRSRPFTIMRPAGHSAMGDKWEPDTREIARRASLPQRGAFAPGEILIALAGSSSAASVDRMAAPGSDALTGDGAADAALRAAGAVSVRPVAAPISGLRSGAAPTRPVSGIDLNRIFVVRLKGVDPLAAARQLRGSPSIAYAGPNWTVSSMALEPRAIPAWAIEKARAAAARRTERSSIRTAQTGRASGGAAGTISDRAATPRSAAAATLPSNFGLTSSFESYLNAGGVNASGAFDILARRYGALPGDGVIVTNVSIGDLTDQAMADAGDAYVQFFGPTTVVSAGQRYLDVPSMPLIPAWGASLDGTLDPLAAVEFVDPFLSEVLLDFSVMAPLPHNLQRPGAEGDGLTDLLGIAPGAQYRLVVPQEPTIANILTALVAAANQEPRPDVITASLGFGFDVTGFPARYLEDDPVVRAAVRSISQDLGIVVCISANDGTRLFTPAAIGTDGGSAPTDLAPSGTVPTSVEQVANSTAPSRLDDSGSIDVGGSTLDDIFSAPPQSGSALRDVGSFPETRYNGSTSFSSGFGTRLNLAAPSDNIPALEHSCDTLGCPAQAVVPVLNGGTSASAPMTAAAAAVVIQSSRLAGAGMTPLQVRDLLARTGRDLPNPPQSVTNLSVGRQVDLTAAVESVVGPDPTPSIARVSVAHRQPLGSLGAAFTEATDPAAIDLEGPPVQFGPPSGQNVTGPITIAADIAGKGSISNPSYALTIGGQTFKRGDPVFRLLPSQILSAAGLGVISTTSREVPLTYDVRSGTHTVASASLTLTIGPSDGTYLEALAPGGPAVVLAGKPFRVTYDLKHVRQVIKPQLIISSVDHWSPAAAPMFRNERIIPISPNDTQVTVPADALTGGAGLYGIGILQDSEGGTYGEFAPLRVSAASGDVRPPAPVLTVQGSAPGYSQSISRRSPQFAIQWDTSAVPGAQGAVLEISAPGQTIWGSINTFTNQNGDRRDNDGVDAGSTLWYPLPGVSGTASLDAAALGLPSSLFYSARVLATGGKGVVGSASAVSGLAFDDGLTPGGETVNDFDIVPGGGSLVATAGFDQFGNLAESGLRPYDETMGVYGPPFAIDGTGQSMYFMFGSDTSLHRSVTIRYDWFGTGQDLELYESRTGAKLASVPVDSALQYALIGGRVDSSRHRAALLGWSGTDFSDNVVPFGTDTGALGNAIFADNGTDNRGYLTTLDIDSSSGNALLARMLWGDLCLFFGSDITSVDIDTAQAQNVAPVANCITGLAADQADRLAYLTTGPIFGFPRLFPVGQYQTVDQQTLKASNLSDLGARSPLFPVVDPVNGLLIVGFAATDNYTLDNNAMSAVGVFTRSGHQISLMKNFNFLAQVFGSNGLVGNERGIQVDPSTRTGWTYGPGGVQVQQFHY